MPRRYFAQSLILTSQENARVDSLRSYPTRQDVAQRNQSHEKIWCCVKVGRKNEFNRACFLLHPSTFSFPCAVRERGVCVHV